MRRIIRAFYLGLTDGWTDGQAFGSGYTWDDDQKLNETYDRGVNVGQFFARFAFRCYAAS